MDPEVWPGLLTLTAPAGPHLELTASSTPTSAVDCR